MGTFQRIAICQRVEMVRRESFGPRGKASFAKKLGISPSTYDYYENGRIPPADLLLKIADIGGVDLRWLLAGESSAGTAVAANHPAVRRVAELIGDHPEAAEPLLAFLDILAGTFAFPAKKSAEQTAETPKVAHLPDFPPSTNEAKPAKSLLASASVLEDTDAKRTWIPILGRSAAGVPRFWSADEDTTGLTTLGDLIARCTESPDAEDVESGQAVTAADGSGGAQPVQIITLRTPIAWGKRGQGEPVAQFIAAGAIKANYPDAFAVRIDGDSMSPEIRHGELVVLSASAPAVAGQPAVVQLTGAIGVTCKLYHPAGKRVNLVPINEQIPPTAVESKQIDWALRVLAHIRPHANSLNS